MSKDENLRQEENKYHGESHKQNKTMKTNSNNGAVNVTLAEATSTLPYGGSETMTESFRGIADVLAEKSGYPVSEEAVEHLWMEQGIDLYDDGESAVYTDKDAGYTLELCWKYDPANKIFAVRAANDGDQTSNKGHKFLESLEEER